MATKKIEERFIDKRVAPRYVSEGVLSQDDWDKHLDSLPDDTPKAEVVDISSAPEEDADGADVDSPAEDDAAEPDVSPAEA